MIATGFMIFAEADFLEVYSRTSRCHSLVLGFSTNLGQFLNLSDNSIYLLGGRLVRSGVIYWSRCTEGLVVVYVVYICC
jgi:hypothetical protein